MMVELLLLDLSLPRDSPLMAYGVVGGQWKAWTKHQAARALRQVVATAGLPPTKYALHSLRTGGATYLQAARSVS